MALCIQKQVLKVKLTKFMTILSSSLHASFRSLNRDAEGNAKKVSDATEVTKRKPIRAPEFVPGVKTAEVPKQIHKTSDFDKWMMAWVFPARYKSSADVPDVVPFQMYWKGRSLLRIRLNMIMMVVTLVFCLGVMQYGKYERNKRYERRQREHGMSTSKEKKD